MAGMLSMPRTAHLMLSALHAIHIHAVLRARSCPAAPHAEKLPMCELEQQHQRAAPHDLWANHSVSSAVGQRADARPPRPTAGVCATAVVCWARLWAVGRRRGTRGASRRLRSRRSSTCWSSTAAQLSPTLRRRTRAREVVVSWKQRSPTRRARRVASPPYVSESGGQIPTCCGLR